MRERAEDHSYFQSRAQQELAMANEAPHPEAARAHKILAGLYLERLDSVVAQGLPRGS
jgi:hypothetical protein